MGDGNELLIQLLTNSRFSCLGLVLLIAQSIKDRITIENYSLFYVLKFGIFLFYSILISKQPKNGQMPDSFLAGSADFQLNVYNYV